ncbi:MAG: Fe-S protein assembly co-chaperone HscB [Burkholderiales bacterium]|nr:Fe-S protein assembly co-chaperone HscB [Burkholderiales bacterium]
MRGEFHSLSKLKEHLIELLSLDCFSLFGISANYSIDETYLKYKYLELQKQSHPDNFVTNAELLKSLSLELSAHINNSYKTLKSPLLRAIAFLSHYGIEFNSNKETELPNNFLFEQIEFHDKIESANNDGNYDELVQIEQEILDSQSSLIAKITDYCAKHDFIQVKELLKQLAFYDRLRSSVESRIEDF